MKIRSFILLILLLLSNSVLSGCWNYHDIEKYSMVSGFSIDKNEQGDKYLVTIEVIDFEMSGREAKQVSRLIESEGNTVFDAVRNVINITGKKLYWAHSNIVIVSQDIAKEGISPVLDLIYRDGEMREEMFIVISKEKTAKEILEQETMTSELRSMDIEQTLRGQESLAKAINVQVYELVGKIEAEGISASLPAISKEENEKKITPKLVGTAMFKSDRLIGFLDSEDTKYFLFATNKINKGLITIKEDSESKVDNVTLEIFKSKTNVKPVYSNGKLTMDLEINTEVSIGEISSPVDYIKRKNTDKLKKDAEAFLKSSVEKVIKKVQNDYGTDIFGFGMHVKADMPWLWKEIEPDWNNLYRRLDINVNTNITIRNSALTSKTIEAGD